MFRVQLRARPPAKSARIVHVYLYGIGNTGYGGASVSLLDPTAQGVFTDIHGNYVVTGAQGGFTFPNFTCAPGQPTYVLAQGGNPGLASGALNPALALIVATGACDDNGGLPVRFINLNEVSTVASVYSLVLARQRLAAQHIQHALQPVLILIDQSTGAAVLNSIVGNGVAPQPTVNTIANMIAACVFSNVTTSSLNTIFINCGSVSGTMPTDTASAVLNLAQNPAANVQALFALAVPNPPFQPSLTIAPNDWTIAITFYADLMAGPYYPAFDAQGNLWVPGYANDTLTQFDPLGIPISGQLGFSGNGLSQPYATAVDSAQSVWVASYAYGATANVSRFTNNGSASGNFPCGTNCTGVALDKLQNVWTAAASGTNAIRNTGAALAQFATTGTAPGIAIDSTGRAWTIGKGRNLLRLTLPNTIDTFPQTVTSTLANDLNMLAIDSSDNVWFTSGKNNAIGRVDSSGKLISPASGYTGGGLKYPAQIAVDGSNRIWVANRDGNSISAFRNDGTPITPATGYTPSGQAAPDPTVPITAVGVKSPHGLAIDGSGNVWVTNFVANSVTEFVGLATPVVTPISPATRGQRP